MPPILLGGPGMFAKALAIYAAAFVVVADRREGGDRRYRTARLGVPRLALRDGARTARGAVDRVRAAGHATRDDGDADVHAGRYAVDDARHDGEHRAQGRAARELVPHGAGRDVRGGRVRPDDRRVHDTARVRHRAVRLTARGGPAEPARSDSAHRLPHDERRLRARSRGERRGSRRARRDRPRSRSCSPRRSCRRSRS